MLAVAGLELAVATDVHEFELEPELEPKLRDDLERPLAEPTVVGVVDADGRYG